MAATEGIDGVDPRIGRKRSSQKQDDRKRSSPRGVDRLDVYDRLREHARIAVEDADDRLAGGDRVAAAIRLVEASELYRLAANQLDPSVSPTS